MFCSDCTLKMQVPAGFEKKGKQGPSRVCHECRHRLVDGATLIDVPYADTTLPPPPPPPAGPTPAGGLAAAAGRGQMPPPPPSSGGRVGAPQASAAADNEETMLPVKFSGEQKTIATVVVTKVL